MGVFSALNPMLLWGGLAVASPIIIHLLNRRRFRIVHWAAMDFLLQADRQNRRRVRLEDLLLLLLRCLIILLIALLVARLLFDPTGLGALGRTLGSTEHIIVLDDSPSMEARAGGGTVFGTATDEIGSFLKTVAETRPQDSCTLLLASDPERPLEQSVPLGAGNVDRLLQRLEDLDPSDVAARLDEALLAVQRQIEEAEGSAVSVLMVTDLKRVDWQASDNEGEGGPAGQDAEGPVKMLERLAEEHPGVDVQIVGMSADSQENLGVVDVRPPRGAVARGMTVPFTVFVRNFGESDADDVTVEFTVGDSVPVRRTLQSIPAGETTATTVPFLFQQTGAAAIRAEIARDVLEADNRRFYAADVTQGTRVLLVNGEAGMRASKSEVFFLETAFTPPGEMASGFRCTVISDAQFESVELSEYQLVVLANVYRLTLEREQTLAEWVEKGGGVAFFLGDQVDPVYHREFHKRFPELFPLRLNEIQGDPQEDKWTSLRVETPNHPMLSVFADEASLLLRRMKFYRYWSASLPEDLPEGAGTLLATFGDVETSPAVVESTHGDGRVLVCATAADDEWSNWVSNPGYVVAIQEMARHLAQTANEQRQLIAGEALRESVDPAEYTLEGTVGTPASEAPVAITATAGESANDMRFEFTETQRAGIYRLHLNRRDEIAEVRPFSVNVNASEGDLKPVGRKTLGKLRSIPNVRVSTGSVGGRQTAGLQRTELWRPLLIALIVTLLIEQIFAWHLGRRRG